MKKKCSNCGEEKELEEFYKDRSRKDGYSNKCKECDKKYQTKRDKKKKAEYQKQYHIKYYQKNRDVILAKNKESYKNNLEYEHRRNKKYRDSHSEELKEKSRKYYQINRDKVKIRHKKYCEKNKDKIREQKTFYKRERLKKDTLFRIKAYLRTDIARVFRRKGNVSSPRIDKIIGCTTQELCIYLLKTWQDRYGTEWCNNPYQIDHIVPLDTANEEKEAYRLFHYTNLQLLTPEDNRKKGIENNSILEKDKV